MFLPTNLNFSNKYFFINFLRFVFSNYNFILFFNILKYSNSFFNSLKLLQHSNLLNSYVINSKVLKAVLKKSFSVDIFSGTYVILYTNNLDNIIFFLTAKKFNFINFIPFALLFEKNFIFLNSFSLGYFISCFRSHNKLIVLNILFFVYFLVFNYFFNLLNFSKSYYFFKPV